MSEGGKGGGATVTGRGVARGGDGGDGGIGEGKGGDGGDAFVGGDGRAAGGGGGSGPTPDGRGGRGARGPTEVIGGRSCTWPYGAGGDGPNHPEYNRRLELLARYRREFCAALPRRAPYVEAGIDPVPVSWINTRLSEEGEEWRVEMGAGGYVLPPLR
jgi:hypothetical protein